MEFSGDFGMDRGWGERVDTRRTKDVAAPTREWGCAEGAED